jgi:hypothetical protein
MAAPLGGGARGPGARITQLGDVDVGAQALLGVSDSIYSLSMCRDLHRQHT